MSEAPSQAEGPGTLNCLERPKGPPMASRSMIVVEAPLQPGPSTAPDSALSRD